MTETIEFLVRHGEAVLFWVVFAEQIGLPIPAIPLLIAAGTLAGAGKMSLASAVLAPVVASLLADGIWYEMGRRRGGQVLGLICRISLEPDSCVRRTENLFLRYGVWSLLLAKFIPGLSTVAPPLAGIVGMTVRRFFFYDGLGALIWAGSCAWLGYLFSHQLERIASAASELGGRLGLLLLAALGTYIAYKFIHRQLFLRHLRISRITVDELRRKLDEGEEPVIVDLRHPVDVQANPHTIPGSLHMLAEEIDQRHHEIPRDRDIILFCSCPNEVTAARTALRLRKKGITKVRPLAGGIEAWRERNYPTEVRALTGGTFTVPGVLA